MKIDVLDSGFVRLVDAMGTDLSIVRAARVSYAADWRAGQDTGSDEKLIGYLMKNRHTSPFEAVTFTFEVKAPIFIFRQWHRHRTWSYNEVSARYTELDEGYYLPDPTKLGTQHDSHKQMRDMSKELPHHVQVDVVHAMGMHCEASFALYKALIEKGVPRELARSVLPVAAYSRMFATVDLHNLMGFLRLRMHSHAQWEIRQYANALCDLAGSICPVTIREFRKSLESNNA
jgi:thymidylate synthase (FAD)